jgi:predicted  nucleic acid-binding Zn-ribbon protein
MNVSDQQFQLLVKMIESLDKRMDSFDKQIESLDKKMERRIDDVKETMQRQFAEVKEEIRDVKHDVRRERDKLQEVYESRDCVTVKFTRAWASASFFMALTAATIVLAVVKAF